MLEVWGIFRMSQNIEMSDECAALLKRQAEASGITIGAWVEVLARVHGDAKSGRRKKKAAAAQDIESRSGLNWLPDTVQRVPRTQLREPPFVRLVYPL